MNINWGYEVVETCLLISPGPVTVVNEFLIDTIALAPGYVQRGVPIVLYINGTKYIEKLEAQCVPFFKLSCAIRLVIYAAPSNSLDMNKSRNVDLYANGDVYLCGKEYRKTSY